MIETHIALRDAKTVALVVLAREAGLKHTCPNPQRLGSSRGISSSGPPALVRPEFLPVGSRRPQSSYVNITYDLNTVRLGSHMLRAPPVPFAPCMLPPASASPCSLSAPSGLHLSSYDPFPEKKMAIANARFRGVCEIYLYT